MIHELWKAYRRHAKPHTKRAVRQILLQRDSHRCQYCGVQVHGQAWHVDHQIAYSRGGKSHVDNLVVSCAPCNMSKSYHTKAVSLRAPIEKRIWAFLLYLPHMRIVDWL